MRGVFFPYLLNAIGEGLGRVTIFNYGKSKAVKTERKIRYAPDKRLFLNITETKERGTEKLPVFVYIHGGGWVSGIPENREAFLTKIAEKGFVCVNVFYGYAQQNYPHPKQIQHVYQALEWLIDNAERLNIDMTRLFLGGDSAGAHLAALAGAASTNPDLAKALEISERAAKLKISGLVLNCGLFNIYDAIEIRFPFMKNFVYAYTGKDIAELKAEKGKVPDTMSPDIYVKKDYPQSLVITAQHDPLRSGGFKFLEVLDKAGVAHEHFHATGALAVHAFAVAQILKQSKMCMEKILEFVTRINTLALRAAEADGGNK